MQPSKPQPAGPERPKADLARLRIERGQEDVGRVRGFPWLRVVILVGAVALLLLFRDPLLGLFGGGGGADVRLGRAVRVVPGQARQGDVSANGYIVADRQASLASVLSGRLVELSAAEGDTVEMGAVVARIQYDDLEVQERRAAAALAAAQARHEQALATAATASARVAEAHKDHEAGVLSAVRLDREVEAARETTAVAREERDRMQREVERNRKLFRDKFINEAEWDRIQTAARTAQNQLDAAEQSLRALEAGRAAWDGQLARRKAASQVAEKDAVAAQKAAVAADAAVEEAREVARLASIQLEKTRIRAPFTGLVIRKDADLGEVIAPTGAGNSRGSVLTIVDPTSLEVQVELSERRITQVARGDRAMVFLDADPQNALPGAVRKIWPRADRSKGSIEVRVKLDEIPADLRPDMAARVVFKGGEEVAEAEEPYVSVPRAALAQRAGATVVFVVRDGRAREVRIVRGEARGADVVVTQGLAGGEQVVLDPPADLQDGDAVDGGGGER